MKTAQELIELLNELPKTGDWFIQLNGRIRRHYEYGPECPLCALIRIYSPSFRGTADYGVANVCDSWITDGMSPSEIDKVANVADNELNYDDKSTPKLAALRARMIEILQPI